MRDELEEDLCFGEDIFASRRSQPRKRVRDSVAARKGVCKELQHGEAEIWLVMKIKGVARAKAIKILDERIARLNAKRAEAEKESAGPALRF